MPSALSHIRILDLSRVLAGPLATQNLADMGAEVIKVERPGAGDDTRHWGPPFLKLPDDATRGDASYFLSVNRGKKSVTVDLTKPDGQEIVRKLAAVSDVVVENYKVGTLARYELGYDDLKAVNPKLVYCSITGFGQTGPYAHLPGYDFVFQGMGGLMSITGHGDGEPGGGPMKVGVAIADMLTGMYATSAILAALEHRHVSGKGQHIDLALLDCVVALSSYQSINYFLSGRIPARMGNAHPNMVPYNVLECDGGHIILAIGNDTQFASFCNVAGHPELADDARFKTVALRLINRDALMPAVAEIVKTKGMAEWVEILEGANVPCGPINDLSQVFEDPQIRHRGMKIDLKHAGGGTAPGLANPIRFSETPIAYRGAAPVLGQDTDAVLGDILGLDADEIDSLRDSGAV